LASLAKSGKNILYVVPVTFWALTIANVHVNFAWIIGEQDVAQAAVKLDWLFIH
jgi:hypothetical protein